MNYDFYYGTFYTIELEIHFDSGYQSVEATMHGTDLAEMKEKVLDVVNAVCDDEGIKDLVFVEATVLENGEWFDSDSFEIERNKE